MHCHDNMDKYCGINVVFQSIITRSFPEVYNMPSFLIRVTI